MLLTVKSQKQKHKEDTVRAGRNRRPNKGLTDLGEGIETRGLIAGWLECRTSYRNEECCYESTTAILHFQVVISW